MRVAFFAAAILLAGCALTAPDGATAPPPVETALGRCQMTNGQVVKIAVETCWRRGGTLTR
jgi:hypothetical protein